MSLCYKIMCSFLPYFFVLHEYTTSPPVLIDGTINITLMKLRITFIKEKLFHISDFEGLENMENTDFLNTPPFFLTDKLV